MLAVGSWQEKGDGKGREKMLAVGGWRSGRTYRQSPIAPCLSPIAHSPLPVTSNVSRLPSSCLLRLTSSCLPGEKLEVINCITYPEKIGT